MATAKWIRPSPQTLAYFERIAPGPPLQIRKMFGMPCRFLNGHMLVGVYQNSLMLHLSEDDRAECIEAGARPLVAQGRELNGYVEIEPGTFDDHTLKLWIVQGMRYLGSLPPNLKLQPAPTARKAIAKRAPSPPRRASAPRKAKAKPKAKAKAKQPAARVAAAKAAQRQAKPARSAKAKRSAQPKQPAKSARKAPPRAKAQPRKRSR